jgi:hypothetical protein
LHQGHLLDFKRVVRALEKKKEQIFFEALQHVTTMGGFEKTL